VTYGVDLDRLADYAAGLLDGTPEAAEVADLIATSPDWAQAYAGLVEADHLVRADLTSLGRADLIMPADVVAQLDATLASATRSDAATERPRLTVIAGEGTGSRTASRTAAAQARRRRNAWLAAAAAAVIAFGGFGVTVLSDMMDRAVTETSGMSGRPGSGAADALGEPAPPAAAPSVGPPRLTASGTNYFAGDLMLGYKSGGAVDPGTLSPEIAGGRGQLKDSQVAPPLRRLVDPVALLTCLRTVTGAYGGQPLSVDFARFENEPALIILLGDAAGRPARLVVVGPACGLPQNGPDVRYSTPVS